MNPIAALTLLLIPGALFGAFAAAMAGIAPPIGAVFGMGVFWAIGVVYNRQRLEHEPVVFHIDVGHIGQLDQIVARLADAGVAAEGEAWIDPDGIEHFLLNARQRDRGAVEREVGWIDAQAASEATDPPTGRPPIA